MPLSECLSFNECGFLWSPGPGRKGVDMLISSPLVIKGRVFPNRCSMSPMVPNCAGEDGSVTEAYRNFYLARARARVGYIVLGGVYVHENGKGFPRQLGIHSDAVKTGLSELAQALGKYSRVGVQLSFKSLQRLPEDFKESEIAVCRKAFVEAAVRARDCGFDAIELHACHDYWLNFFLSPHFNHRRDAYGGSLENRSRLLREIVRDIRSAVGDSMILGVRLSMEEFVEDGLTLSETLQVGTWLEKLGVDYLSASGGIGKTQHRMSPPMEVPRGSLLYLAEALKRSVSVPVIGVGRLDRPEVFRKAVEEGCADIAGVGRSLIADPEYVAKVLDGRDEDIRPCLACNYCLLCLHRGEDVRCAVNPLVGRDLYRPVPLRGRLNVLVVGAGPAGLAAAAAAAERGAAVRLVEKDAVPGGMLNAGKVPPHKEPIQEFIDYLVKRAAACGVEIVTGHAVEASDIRALAPDRVIVATGSASIALRADGLEGNERVVLVESLLRSGRISTGGRYIVVGGGAAGLETAEFIAENGGSVTVIEMTETLGRGLHATRLNLMLENLARLNVAVMPNTRLVSVDGGAVRAETPGGPVVLGPFDTIVMAVGYRSEATLSRGLDPRFAATVIGDALQPRSIYEAVKEGFDAAVALKA
ncbi:FAD-dependent oxidoreductase [Syntrophobacter fumaroxidans]|uniref:NADH:flavin oxidoreductase/NADH oxidase n=1 Tax=Syntrophobacter fumaroxidans (strain DSM 10017 / MPOB) TaxID=335543 RepID=A0LP96_SYNFM|nr:FAD-dependent oxidoreductase [Syntrophobacter fumaroxidans]ABK19248.1 NADH:flavin oxidoreductase/NADH oxidase [Syntrophobacter fumaroxidans MPOB]